MLCAKLIDISNREARIKVGSQLIGCIAITRCARERRRIVDGKRIDGCTRIRRGSVHVRRRYRNGGCFYCSRDDAVGRGCKNHRMQSTISRRRRAGEGVGTVSIVGKAAEGREGTFPCIIQREENRDTSLAAVDRDGRTDKWLSGALVRGGRGMGVVDGGSTGGPGQHRHGQQKRGEQQPEATSLHAAF